MTAISAFFDRFDGMKPDAEGRDPASDEEIARAGREMSPIYAQHAERAGLELEDLIQEQIERLNRLPEIVIRRAGDAADDPLEVEPLERQMLIAFVNIGVENFLAGVVWEQGRHLPELDIDIEPDP